GTFGVEKLSPGVQYEVVFLVMMKDLAYGWEVPVKLRLILPDGNSQEHEENLKEKPKGKWMEISVGELRTTTENSGDIQFSLDEYNCGLWKRGLVIKGVIIRPKV
ncbi:hypothetical protein, partial [Salmonella sp. s57610]|uniref:hypothetical protein n=1 Tax=Salmonella sp. s57610 TaxID=3159697 RepID=UPI003980919C